uniref:Testicular haploid expressed gene protein-like n=1 Tax=Geotrypetes seraphini TaxID=260995 RepID=A0A6P8RFC5_GEOSA|nr:testicular haploid expressed gene protein-like [Geotrypetes seraphini]
MRFAGEEACRRQKEKKFGCSQKEVQPETHEITSQQRCDHGSGSWPRAHISDLHTKPILNQAEKKFSANHQKLSESSLSPAAFKSRCDRISNLARPKSVNSYRHDNKEEIRSITEAALNAIASARIKQLACPKHRSTIDLGRSDKPLWKVPRNARYKAVSPRLEQLAAAKHVPSSYQPDRNSKWSVSIKTKLAVVSPRIIELSKPIQRGRPSETDQVGK